MSRQQQPNQGWAARLSPLIAAAGVVAVPALLVRHQGRLGITNAELVYLLHVLSHRWDATTWPWVAIESVATAAAVHETVARRWKASLEAKGYLAARPRVIPGIGRRADEHDLTGLFAALERLAEEEETRKALDKVRDDLPQPTFARAGLSDVPQLSTGRPSKIARRRASKNASPGASKTASPPHALSRGAARAKTLPEIKTGSPETGRRIREGEPEHTETNRDRVAAPRPDGGNQQPPDDRHTHDATSGPRTPTPLDTHVAAEEEADGVYRPLSPQAHSLVREQLERAVARLVATRGSTDRDGGWEVPIAYDEGIWASLETYCEEFGDNDPARSLEVAHHLWWNSGLPREAMHNAMKAAYYSTRNLYRKQAIARPMAYFFTALKTVIVDQQVSQGLRRTG